MGGGGFKGEGKHPLLDSTLEFDFQVSRERWSGGRKLSITFGNVWLQGLMGGDFSTQTS